MENFEFFTPTRMIFGKNTHQQVGKIVKEYGFKKVLVHFGGASARKSGLLDAVTGALEAEGIQYVTLGGVQANPTLAKAKEGIELCLREGVDLVLAVGGGSVIDSAKCIADGAGNPDADVWTYFRQEAVPARALPVGVILTLSASGSEMSASCVITNEENGFKRGFNSVTHRPLFSICNPELTYTVSKFQTGCGTVDIMMHTLERYLSYGWDNEITDNIAESLLRTVIKYAPIALKQGDDYQARSELMWCGSLSHCDLTGLGMPGDWAVHQIEHELSTEYQVAHGAGLAAVWGSWANYTLDAGERRFARYARNVWKIAESEDRKAAEAGIQATEGFFAGLGMPISVSQLIGRKMTQEEITKLAHKCTFGGKRTIGNLIVMKEPQIEKIYQLANH